MRFWPLWRFAISECSQVINCYWNRRTKTGFIIYSASLGFTVSCWDWVTTNLEQQSQSTRSHLRDTDAEGDWWRQNTEHDTVTGQLCLSCQPCDASPVFSPCPPDHIMFASYLHIYHYTFHFTSKSTTSTGCTKTSTPLMIFANFQQEVKVIWQKVPHGGPIPQLGATPGGRNLYHWIPGVGVPISVP